MAATSGMLDTRKQGGNKRGGQGGCQGSMKTFQMGGTSIAPRQSIDHRGAFRPASA